MKTLIAIGVILLLLIIGWNTCVYHVQQGYEGIIINNVGSNRGLVDQKGVTGYGAINPLTEHVVILPIFMQRVVWCAKSDEGNAGNEEIAVNSLEGTRINFDIAVNWRIVPGMGGQVYAKYRKDADQLTASVIRDAVRKAMQVEASKMEVMKLYTTGLGAYADAVQKSLNEKLGKEGFEFGTFSINDKRLTDKNIEDAINVAITQTQKTKAAVLKVDQITAEAKQRVAMAEGEAKANNVLNASITDKLIRMKTLDNERLSIGAWEKGGSKVPDTLVQGGGNNGAFGFLKDIGVKHE